MNKKSKFKLHISEAEYDRLSLLVNKDIPAECYTDYYFETGEFWFKKHNSSIKIRERGDSYTLVMTKSDDVTGALAVRTYEKPITVADFVSCIKRGIPKDLVEDFPIDWKNSPLEFREIINLSHTDTEALAVILSGDHTIVIKEIDYITTTRYEIECEYKDENELLAIKKDLQSKGINWIPEKKSEYELLFKAWKDSFIGEDAEPDNEIKISFKSKLIPGFTHEQTFTISLRTIDGRMIHKTLVNYVKEEFGINAIVWQEPKGLLDKARYVTKNLKKALAKVELSDKYNGQSFHEDSDSYKFYGITQKEYLAVKRAEVDFYNIVAASADEMFRTIAYELVDLSLAHQEIADKYFDGKIKKANYEVLKFHNALAEQYGRLVEVEAGEYPAFDVLSPLHQQYIQTAFNLLVAVGEEEYDALDLRGENLYWDYMHPGKRNISEEELQKLLELHKRLFALG